MKLYKYSNKNVKIVFKDGNELVGIAYDYTNPQDNVPEVASISIGNVEILETEILSIEEIIS